MRVLRDTQATLRSTWYQDGTPTDPGTVTIGIVDLLGNDIVTAGTATTDNTDGTFDYSLAGQPDVDYGIVTWTEAGGDSIEDTLEVVGGHLFTEAAARAFDGGALQDETRYPDADILAERDYVTDTLETLTGRSWVTRYRLMQFRGTGTRELWLPHYVRSLGGSDGDGAWRDTVKVLAASDQNGSINVANIVLADHGLLLRTDADWALPSTTDPVNITLELEYGVRGRPEGVTRTALELAVDRLRDTNIPDRAISWTDEFGNIRLDTMPTVARKWIMSHDYRLKAW